MIEVKNYSVFIGDYEIDIEIKTSDETSIHLSTIFPRRNKYITARSIKYIDVNPKSLNEELGAFFPDTKIEVIHIREKTVSEFLHAVLMKADLTIFKRRCNEPTIEFIRDYQIKTTKE